VNWKLVELVIAACRQAVHVLNFHDSIPLASNADRATVACHSALE